MIGIEFPWFDKIFDFGNRDFRGGCHQGIEVSGGFAVDQIAEPVSAPSLYECEIGGESSFHDICAAIELAHFLPIRYDCADASRRKECRDACSSRADSFGERALWNEGNFKRSGNDHGFEQPVFTDVASNMRCDAASLEQFSQSKAIDA